MTILRVTANFSRIILTYQPVGPIAPTPQIFLDMDFVLIVDHVICRKLIIYMQAMDYGNPDNLKCQLLQSCYGQRSMCDEWILPEDAFDNVTTEILSPADEILKWLGLDIFDTFKNAKYDKPLRLSPANS